MGKIIVISFCTNILLHIVINLFIIIPSVNSKTILWIKTKMKLSSLCHHFYPYSNYNYNIVKNTLELQHLRVSHPFKVDTFGICI